MTDVQAVVAELLEEKPALHDGLETILDVDAADETWTFDDVPFDSGTFGELVSRGVVEKRDGEYTLADRDAVRQALGIESTDEVSEHSDRNSPASLFEGVSMPNRRVERPVATFALVGALGLVVLFRVLPWPAVFRGEDVVLSGNDPYYYRYLVHQMLEASAGVLDVSVLGSLPGGVSHGEPLLVVTLWFVSGIFGGVEAVGGVLAWYPVASAVITALLIYVLTVRVTDDRRAGIAAVALLAIMPGHAFRTGLGFADHHAFDYPWLALTALAVVSVVGRDSKGWRTWVWGLVLGIGVAGQTLAWDAGPLILVPIGLFVAAVVPSWIRAGRSPAQEAVVFVGGLGLSSVLVVGAHLGWGWHPPAVIISPVLLFVGTLVVVGLGDLARRIELSARSLFGIELLVGITGFALVWMLVPAFADEFGRGVAFLISKGGIAETTSLVSGALGTVIGPIILFGFALFLAVPYLAWSSWRCYRADLPAWLVVSIYGWYFLLLSVIQIRFAGQLALFTAVFGGLGFVHLAAWVDLGSYPRPFENRRAESERAGFPSRDDEPSRSDDLEWPERRRALSLMGLGLGVGSLGLINTPIKHSQLLIDESMYEAARFMREYSQERGWEYPENYVFSEWGRNRVYNWFVNGESRSYGFAQSNFRRFVAASDGQEWYERLGGRAGFVAVEENGASGSGERRTLHDQLWSDAFGVETDHYRAVWTDSDDSLRVFTLVPGARITGPAPANSTVTIDVSAEVGGQSKSITMESDVGEHGVYQETVPLPGTYDITDTSYTISEDNVEEGALLSAFNGEGYAHWSFDEGSGEWAYDRVGGHHGRIHGAEWTDGRSGPALSFGGKGSSDYVEAPIESLQEFTISLWAYPTALDVSEENDYRYVVRAGGGSILVFEENGRISFRLPGAGGGRVRVFDNVITTKEWRQITITFDGAAREIYVDGERRAHDEVSIGDLDWRGRIRIGNDMDGPMNHGYAGLLDEVWISDRALSSEEINRRLR